MSTNTKDSFGDILEAARQMQKSMESAQKQLNMQEETGEAGGGLVKVTMNGHHKPTRVVLDNSLSTSNTDLRHLERLILSAIEDAVNRVEKTSQDTMMNLTKGIDFPDMKLLTEEEQG